MVTSSRLTWLVLEVMELQRLSFQRETLETSDICSPPVQCTQLLARVSFFRVRTWAKFLKHQRIGQREISKSLLLLMVSVSSGLGVLVARNGDSGRKTLSIDSIRRITCLCRHKQ
uniref:Uncharacterized protein n=1 Tax=Populus trichocarpa TaxID=3694 RepID=A0A3N7G8D4_POPTR|eukprot:XP_024454441.1 uncharacterized protein LOC18097449 isoform X3 [Populus trichocarpa]